MEAQGGDARPDVPRCHLVTRGGRRRAPLTGLYLLVDLTVKGGKRVEIIKRD